MTSIPILRAFFEKTVQGPGMSHQVKHWTICLVNNKILHACMTVIFVIKQQVLLIVKVQCHVTSSNIWPTLCIWVFDSNNLKQAKYFVHNVHGRLRKFMCLPENSRITFQHASVLNKTVLWFSQITVNSSNYDNFNIVQIKIKLWHKVKLWLIF